MDSRLRTGSSHNRSARGSRAGAPADVARNGLTPNGGAQRCDDWPRTQQSARVAAPRSRSARAMDLASMPSRPNTERSLRAPCAWHGLATPKRPSGPTLAGDYRPCRCVLPPRQSSRRASPAESPPMLGSALQLVPARFWYRSAALRSGCASSRAANHVSPVRPRPAEAPYPGGLSMKWVTAPEDFSRQPPSPISRSQCDGRAAEDKGGGRKS